MTPQEMDRLVQQLGDGELQVFAFARLVQVGQRTLPSLSRGLNDSDPMVRRNAARVIRRLADARSIPLLISILGNKDTAVTSEITIVLVQIGAPAVPPLIHALADGDGTTRSNARRTLREVGEERVIALLTQELQDRVPMVRQRAARALGNFGSIAALEPLLERLGEPEPDVRKAIAQALIRIGQPAIPPLIGKLGAEDPIVCRTAIAALKGLGHTDTLLRLILKEPGLTSRQRFTALNGLERVPDLQEYCREKLYDVHESVRQGAQSVLEVSTLLLPSSRDDSLEKEELLRGAEPSVSQIAPEEMLRAADPTEPPPQSRKRRAWLANWVRRNRSER